MRIAKLGTVAAAVACVGMQLAPVAMAAPVAAPKTADVALLEGGVLHGQITNAQGVSVAKVPVAVFANGKEIARTETNAKGDFAVNGLKGGVYHVAAAGQVGAYRLWAPNTAPPMAKQGVMFVADGDVVSGQYGGGGPFSGVVDFISRHPIATGLGVAAAIAIPLAIDDDDDPAS